MTPTQKLERVVKAVMALIVLVATATMLAYTLGDFWDPASPLRHFREPLPAPQQVLARGTLRRTPHEVEGAIPPLCDVRWQRWEQCGKNKCWSARATLRVSSGSLDVAWSSAPLPASVPLAPTWDAEPGLDGVVVTDLQRAAAWAAEARRRQVDLRPVTDSPGQDRLLERCLEDGAPVFVSACLTGDQLGPCPGRDSYALVPSASPRPAIARAVNRLALQSGGELLLLVAVAVLLIPPRRALVDALAARAGRAHARRGEWWLLWALPLGACVWNVVTDAGRGGFVALSTAALAWAFVAKHVASRWRLAETARGPVLAVARSPLARAAGTTELLVRAKLVGHGAPRLLGPARAAFVETRVVELYGQGKNKQRTEPVVLGAERQLHVADESGEGVLDLRHAVLDVKVDELTCDELPPSFAAHGVHLPRHEHHASWSVEERAIADGERLFVLGEVSAVNVRPDGVGYRSVVGSPLLGGAGVPPVVVFSGDERGLLATLRAEGRFTLGLAIGCATVAASIVAFAGVLARL